MKAVLRILSFLITASLFKLSLHAGDIISARNDLEVFGVMVKFQTKFKIMLEAALTPRDLDSFLRDNFVT